MMADALRIGWVDRSRVGEGVDTTRIGQAAGLNIASVLPSSQCVESPDSAQ